MFDKRCPFPNLMSLMIWLPSGLLFSIIWAYHLPSNHYRTVVGIIFHSPQVFILFLALAAGAILSVVAELLGQAKRERAPEIVMWGLLIGFLLGYVTDLIVTYAGA